VGRTCPPDRLTPPSLMAARLTVSLAVERFGIVNRVIADADLISDATAFAEKIAESH